MAAILAIALIWGTLIAAPPSSSFAASFLHKEHPPIYRRVLHAAALLCGLTLACILLKIRFADPSANMFWVCLLYFAYCFLTTAFRLLQNKLLRYACLAVAYIPILIGYALATIGILGLAFIMSEEVAAPAQTESIAPNIICETAYWGGAMTDSGYAVTISQIYWPSLPILKRTLARQSVNQSAGQPGTSCTALSSTL